jgi:hypothetical protein
MIFGNTVGRVESRRGKLDGRLEVRDGLAGMQEYAEPAIESLREKLAAATD